MKSMTKKLTILLIVALLLVTMCALAACDPKDDGLKGTAGKFTVQVLLPDGTPVKASSGIYVQLCTIKDEQEDNCQAFKVDDNGTVCEEVENGAKVCNIHLQKVPSQYKVPADKEHAQVNVGEAVVIKLENA